MSNNSYQFQPHRAEIRSLQSLALSLLDGFPVKQPINGFHPAKETGEDPSGFAQFDGKPAEVASVYPREMTAQPLTIVKTMPTRPEGEIEVLSDPTWHTELLSSGATLLQVYHPVHGWISIVMFAGQRELMMKTLLEQALRTPDITRVRKS